MVRRQKKPVLCPDCDKQLAYAGLARHRRIMHGIEVFYK